MFFPILEDTFEAKQVQQLPHAKKTQKKQCFKTFLIRI